MKHCVAIAEIPGSDDLADQEERTCISSSPGPRVPTPLRASRIADTEMGGASSAADMAKWSEYPMTPEPVPRRRSASISAARGISCAITPLTLLTPLTLISKAAMAVVVSDAAVRPRHSTSDLKR
ncbi:MAG: hypothetical protein ACJ8GV_00190 [Luteimonas sp.]